MTRVKGEACCPARFLTLATSFPSHLVTKHMDQKVHFPPPSGHTLAFSSAPCRTPAVAPRTPAHAGSVACSRSHRFTPVQGTPVPGRGGASSCTGTRDTHLCTQESRWSKGTS